MSSEIEYERPYHRHEPESLQKFIIKFVRYYIKSMYPDTIFASMIDDHLKKYVPYSGESDYQLDYRSKGKH